MEGSSLNRPSPSGSTDSTAPHGHTSSRAAIKEKRILFIIICGLAYTWVRQFKCKVMDTVFVVKPVHEQIAELFILAIPIACVAWTVTHEEVFREPREWCVERSKACRKLLQRK